jgi:hypothetical protein
MVSVSFLNRLSQAVDRIENQSQPRPFKVAQIFCGYDEEWDFARARHYAARPQDRDADVIIRLFHDPKETASDSRKQ